MTAPSSIIPWVKPEDLECGCEHSCDVELVARAATVIADNLSGHRFGLRELRLRPHANSPSCSCDGTSVGAYWGFGFGAWFFPLWWSHCGCGAVTEIRLTEPVWSISTVTVDGAVLDPSAWVLYGDSRLARVDGGRFPCCQRLNRNPDTGTGTLEVACVVGSAVDEAAQFAVQEIGCELIRAIAKPADCRLPRRVQQITRQQLAVVFADPAGSLSRGFTGLPMVDLWLGSLDAESKRHVGRAVDLASLTAWRGPAA